MGGQASVISENPIPNEQVSPTVNAQHSKSKESIDPCPHFQQPRKATNEKEIIPRECPMSGSTINKDIDPRNMMPPANQMPASDQPFLLSTARITSNIPKASGKDENWVDIHRQQFIFIHKCIVLGLSIATNVLECHAT
jgi:hypothetical protein